MAIKKLLGQKIKTLRNEKRLTQEELAEEVGIESVSYISKIERGLSLPSYELLGKAAKALSVDLKDLFNFKDPKEIEKTDRVKSVDKWILKFKNLLKNCKEQEIKAALG